MPPRQQQGQPQYLDEHHQRISEFAAEYFDEDEEERDNFVNELMTRRGYIARTRTDWEPPADPKGGGGGGGQGQQQRKPSYFKPR